MPLTTGEAIGYDDKHMCYNFTMMHNDKVVECMISSIAMDELADRWSSRGTDREEQFRNFREEIEAYASAMFDASGLERGKVRIFAKHMRLRNDRSA